MDAIRLELSDLARLPRWGLTAFACRCCRRVLPVLERCGVDPQGEAKRCLAAIESAASRAAELDEAAVFRLLDRVDDLEVECRGQSDKAHRFAACVLSAVKFSAFTAIDGSPNPVHNAHAAYNSALSAALFVADDNDDTWEANYEKITKPAMRRDFDTLVQAVEKSVVPVDGPVPSDVFGDLWPGGSPKWAHGLAEWDSYR